MAGPIEYIKETRSELRHVSWPTREQALHYTALVIIVSIVTAVLLGSFDYFYDYAVNNYVVSNITVTPQATNSNPPFTVSTSTVPVANSQASPGSTPATTPSTSGK